MKTQNPVMALTAVLAALAAGCSSAPRTPAGDLAPNSAPAPELTIWKLQAMAEQGQLDELNDLFNNHGLEIKELPVGYAAGAGARVGGMSNKLLTKWLDAFTGKNWRGKIFFHSKDGKMSKGLNRIRKSILLPGSEIVPMASFQVELVDHDALVPEARSSIIILNYSQPRTQNYAQERILAHVQVYDVVVAVQGKYGPLLIGKTFLGKYGKDRHFTAFKKDKLIAWFFLDFNAAALEAQQADHWDGLKEQKFNPIPELTERLSTLAQ